MRARIFAVLSLATALPALAAITGTVMTRDGQPLAGAKVSTYALETADARRARFLAASAERTALGSATTNARGAFTLESPKDAVVLLRVDAAGYAPATDDVERDDDSLVFALTAAPNRQGTITAAGKPLAGARVAWISGTTESIATTDANGHYTVADPSKWAQRVVIRHPDYALREEMQVMRKMDLDFVLDPGVAVSGRVMAGDAPAAKATIAIDNWPVATSGDDGSFTIPHAPAKWELLESRLGDRVASRAREGKSSSTLKLANGAAISGSVRDSKAQPVIGATVALLASAGGGPRMGGAGRTAVATAITDAKGTYTFTNVRAASYQLVVQHPAFSAAPQNVAVTAGARVQKPLLATARARVTGTVVDEEKRGVAASMISAETVSRDPMGLPRGIRRLMSGGLPQRPAFSGPDGRFSLRTDSEGDVELEAAKKGLPTAKSSAIRLAPGERKSGVVITMQRGIALTGRVTDANGKPLSGVAVVASENEGGPMGGNMRRMVFAAIRGASDDADAVTTGSDGQFTMRLKAGSYDVNFKREGFAAKNVRAVAVNAAIKPMEVTLDPGVEITGRVTRSGRPVEGVNVAVMSSDAMNSTTTAGDGRFTIGDLTPGPYMVIFNKQDEFIQQMKNLTAPARDITIDLPPGGRITGHVVDKSTHQPVTSFQAGVSVARSGGGMVIDVPPSLKNFTSDDGSFVLDNVPAGQVQVVASAPGYTTSRLTNITVEEDKPVENLELALETGVRLSGRVTGPDGSPLSGVTVRPDSSAGGGMRVVRQFGGPESVTTTDANGEYSMDQLEPGQKSFAFAHEGYLPVTKSVELSGRDAHLDAQLSSGMRITGQVTTDAGAPVPDADVRASSAVSGGGYRATRSDATGNFSLEGLPAGHYTFSASKSGYADGTLRDFDISSGAPVRIALKTGGVVYGHVNGVAPADLEHVNVTVRGNGGAGEASVDNAGNYRVEGAPIGTVRVTAELMRNFGDMRSSEPKSAEVAAGSAVQVDVDFNSNVVIRGHVSRNGAPVAGGTLSFIPEGRTNGSQVQVPTDDSGNYTAAGLSDGGTYTVMIVDMQRLNSYSTKYDVHGSATFDIDMKTGQLRGRVLEAGTGNGLGNANVRLRGKDSGIGGMIAMRAATTDDNGNFSFDAVSSGSYTLTASKDTYGDDVRDVNFTDTAPPQVELRLAKNDGIHLRVVDARDQQPLNPALVVYDTAGREVFTSMFRGGGGETTKLTLAPGQYRAVIGAANYAPVTVTLTSPGSPTIALTPGGNIAVHASAADANRRARLVDSRGSVYLRPFTPEPTYALGGTTTLINNVAPGRYRLEVIGGSSVVATKDVVVVEGQTVPVDL